MDDKSREEIFAGNLNRHLKARLEQTGESAAKFARRLDLPYGWLIRITTKGVKQTSKRTYHHLEVLLKELEVVDVEDLWCDWNPRLPEPDVIEAALKKRHPVHYAIFLAYHHTHFDGTPMDDIKYANDHFKSVFEGIYKDPVWKNLDHVIERVVKIVEDEIRVVSLDSFKLVPIATN